MPMTVPTARMTQTVPLMPPAIASLINEPPEVIVVGGDAQRKERRQRHAHLHQIGILDPADGIMCSKPAKPSKSRRIKQITQW